MSKLMRIVLIAMFLGLAIPGLTLVGQAAGPAAAPATPMYHVEFRDCVTGNNVFVNTTTDKWSWYVNQAPGADGAIGPLKCDSYQNDQYERPTDQTFNYLGIGTKPPAGAYLSGLAPDPEFAAGQTVYATKDGLYFEYVDITRAWAGYDGQWLYFRIELFGTDQVDSAGSAVDKFAEGTYYTVRLGTNADPNKPNGGIILRNQREQNITTSWSADSSSVKIFRDTNLDAGGAKGVNFSKDDSDPILSNDGYDLDMGNSSWLYVRRVDVAFTGPGGAVTRPAIEFALDYAKFQQDESLDFSPAKIAYLEFDATRGLKDNQNYLWNDEYTLNEAGSPNPAAGGPNGGHLGEAGTSGTGNIYQLDTLRGYGGLTLEYGDHPDPFYATVNTSDGARHVYFTNYLYLGSFPPGTSDPGTYLGTLLDLELDGQPDANADGDDSLDGGDDEDGVERTGSWSDGDGNLLVTVSGAAACLNIWLDFTDGLAILPAGDGDYADTYAVGGTFPEHVVTNLPMSPGANQAVSFPLPAGAAENAAWYLRARLTPRDAGGGCDAAEAYGGQASAYGQAYNGEVEDYLYRFTPTAVTLRELAVGSRPPVMSLALVAGALLSGGGVAYLLRRRRAQVEA